MLNIVPVNSFLHSLQRFRIKKFLSRCKMRAPYSYKHFFNLAVFCIKPITPSSNFLIPEKIPTVQLQNKVNIFYDAKNSHNVVEKKYTLYYGDM